MKKQNKLVIVLLIICLVTANLIFFITPALANGSVIINEIAWMGTETSADAEWIELYNTTTQDIVLDGWSLAAVDGTPTIALQGTIVANSYFLLERTSDGSVPSVTANQIYVKALGNSGEHLILKDNAENIIYQLDNSSKWQAGDNTTKQTMSLVNGSWVNSLSAGGTPKQINDRVQTETPPPPDTIPPPNNSTAPVSNIYLVAVGEVIINELVSDPIDGGEEWVELFNRGGNNINLSEFTLTEGSGAVTTLTGTMDSQNRYAIFYSPKGNLNNSGDVVFLKYKDKIIDQLTYGNWDDGNLSDNAIAVPDPFSLARLPDGLDNNHDLSDFGKAFTTPSSKNTASTETIVETTGPTTTKPKLIINELYPNPPLGDYNYEFIEIKNIGASAVDLKDYSITDNLARYTIGNKQIEPNAILLFNRTETRLALDNDGETIKIVSPAGQTIDSLTYKKPVPVGASWSRNIKGDYYWSSTITPGEENIIIEINKPPEIVWELPVEFLSKTPLMFEASDSADPNGDEINFLWDFGDGYTADHATPTHVYANNGKYVLKLIVTDEFGLSTEKSKNITVGEVSTIASNIGTTPVSLNNIGLDGVKSLSSRTKVTVKGIVASTPNMFNKDIFLSGSGLQLYLSAGEWPELVIGDEVSVTGTVSQTKSYGTRLLVKGADNINVLGFTGESNPTELAIKDISNKYESWFVTLNGEIIDSKSNNLVIADEDKTLKIYFKTGINKPVLAVGQKIKVTGFLVINNGEFRLWPRESEDIEILGSEPRVEGASDTNIATVKHNYLGYGFIILALAIILLGYIWEKKKWPKPRELIVKIFSK